MIVIIEVVIRHQREQLEGNDCEGEDVCFRSLEEVCAVAPQFGQQLWRQVGPFLCGDVVEQLEVGVYAVAQLGVCELVCPTLCAEDRLFVDVHVFVAVVVEDYQAAHHCTQYVPYFLLRKAFLVALSLRKLVFEGAVQVLEVDCDPVIFAADFVGLSRLYFFNLYEKLPHPFAAEGLSHSQFAQQAGVFVL